VGSRVSLRLFVSLILVLVALIHAMPLLGVLGAERLAALYGIPVAEPNLEILLRHRAVLFGMLAGFLANCAIRPRLHATGVAVGLFSVATFLALAYLVGGFNDAIARVVLADQVALGLLALGGVLLWFSTDP
jgi:hypothetical protein